MITVNKLVPQGRGLAKVLLERASQVELGWDERCKSRLEATDSAGRALGIFLPRGSVMRGGDVLVAEDGSLVRVVAAPQPVLVVQACATHGTPLDLLRAAYHLGNRHVQVELREDRLLLEPDHVLAGMLRGNHLIVTEAQAAFEPEGGAYASAGHGHGHHDHDHGHHAHGHGHAHADDQVHEHEHEHAPAHQHEPGHAQGHAHGHAHDHDHAQAHGDDHRHDRGNDQKPGHGGPHGH